jgi:hypothetical protein
MIPTDCLHLAPQTAPRAAGAHGRPGRRRLDLVGAVPRPVGLKWREGVAAARACEVACLTFVVAANHHGPTGGGPAGRMLLAGRSALLRSVRPERTDMPRSVRRYETSVHALKLTRVATSCRRPIGAGCTGAGRRTSPLRESVWIQLPAATRRAGSARGRRRSTCPARPRRQAWEHLAADRR